MPVFVLSVAFLALSFVVVVVAAVVVAVLSGRGSGGELQGIKRQFEVTQYATCGHCAVASI